MVRSIYLCSVVSLCATIAACGSSVDVQMGTLTEAEAIELAAATLFATFNSTSVVPPRPASLPTGEGSPLGWMTSFEAEVRCPGGGRVGLATSVVVRVDPASGESEAVYRMGQVHDDCQVQAGGNPRYAISGEPRVEAEVEARHDSRGRTVWTGEASGRIDWVSATGEGVCDVDVRFTAEAAGPGRTVASLTGQVCEHMVDSDVPIR